MCFVCSCKHRSMRMRINEENMQISRIRTLCISFQVSSRIMTAIAACCYELSNIEVRTFTCKTNLQSNTSCRGFGWPQGSIIVETFMSHAADSLNIDQCKVSDVARGLTRTRIMVPPCQWWGHTIIKSWKSFVTLLVHVSYNYYKCYILDNCSKASKGGNLYKRG